MAPSSAKRAHFDENTPPFAASHPQLATEFRYEQYEPEDTSKPKKKRKYTKTIVLTEEIRAANKAAWDQHAPEREQMVEEARAEAAKLIREERLAAVKRVLDSVKDSGFTTLWDFIEALFTNKDQHVSAWVSRLCRDHGIEMHTFIHLRQREASEEWACKQLSGILQSEGRRLTELFKPAAGATITDILKTFSMEGLLEKAKEAAPMLFLSLSTLVGFEEGSEGRKHKDVVLGTILAIVAQCRNERANEFQTVLCIYLLACGATRSLFDVLNHAGLSLSYTAAVRKLKTLASENLDQLRRLARERKFMIVWDNINIAFRVGQQRLDNKDHFDNGTTATLIPIYNVKRGEFPLDDLTPRSTKKITFEYSTSSDYLPSTAVMVQVEQSMLWHLQDILVQAYPSIHMRFKDSAHFGPPIVDAIPLRTDKQYPIPAAFIDESTLDGTLSIIDHILFKTLGMSEVDLKEHGAVLAHGDQLTVSLIEAVCGSRRDDTHLPDNPSRFLKPQLGLFHTKMAGVRCTVNEHWGIPNSKAKFSLWRMCMLLGRKAMAAGWKSKQLPDVRASTELMIDLVLPATILDGFRLHCGHADGDLDVWVASLRSFAEVRTVARKVLEKLCSAREVTRLRKLPPTKKDITLENVILFNRDALLLLTLRSATKRGDIGSVVNVLHYWMVMFRGTGKMPKYADTLFSTLMELRRMTDASRCIFLHSWLVNLSGQPNRWKEIDLLQEHQNFWLKIIYAARGANRSWEWMSVVSVCIFALRDVIRQVQVNFKTPFNGKSHTSPSAVNDIAKVRQYLEEHKIQSYEEDREANEYATPVRDLMSEGARYANSANPFKNFRRARTKAMYRKSMTGASEIISETTGLEHEDRDVESELESDDEVGFDELANDEDEYPQGCDPEQMRSIVTEVINSFPDPSTIEASSM